MTLPLLLALLAPPAPDCNLAPGWNPRGEPRTHDKENLFEYMNGNAEGYIAYGFNLMNGITCKKGEVILNIDVYEMVDEEAAYGIFVANRDPRAPNTQLGVAGQVLPRRATFVKGIMYAEISAEPEADHTALLRDWSAALERKVPGGTKLPPTLSLFPEGGSARYVPQSVLGMRFLKRGYTSEYSDGRAFLVLEATPDMAAKLRERWKADSSGCGQDAYLGSVCYFLKGNLLGGWVKAPDAKTAAARASALAARVP